MHPRRSVLCPWAVVLLVDLSLSGPGACLLPPWSGVLSVHLVERVVRRCYQGHSERQLLVTPVQPSLPSSLRSANRGLRARVHHHIRLHSNGNADLRKDAWWWWCVCGEEGRERRGWGGVGLGWGGVESGGGEEGGEGRERREGRVMFDFSVFWTFFGPIQK